MPADRYMDISPDLIYPNPRNPRKTFDAESMAELVDNVRQYGVLQPLVVVEAGRSLLDVFSEPVDNAPAMRYRLVCGERRWRAAKEAGLPLVPVVVKDLTPEQELEIMIIENWQRKDVDPIEEAQGLKALLDAGGYTQEELARKIGCSQSQIANRLRLLDLPDSVKENISRGIISVSVAKELLTCKRANPAIIQKVAERAAEEGMTVKEVAAAVASEMWDSSRPLTKNDWPPPAFDVGPCEKCKRKTMLKSPYGQGEKLRCLDLECWIGKQKEAEKKAAEEKEREYLARFPDAVIIDDLSVKIRTVFAPLVEYCMAKECPNIKKGRWRGSGYVENICLDPGQSDRCRDELFRKQKAEREEKEAAERDEIDRLVDFRLVEITDGAGIFISRDALMYIAGALLGGFECHGIDTTDVFKYLERVVGKLPEEWEDGGPCDAQGWPHLRKIFEGLSDFELLHLVIEYPAVVLGIEPGGMVEWFLKSQELAEEAAPKISDRVRWILNCSVGDSNFDSKIPKLTDEELIYCLRNENRKSGLQKLRAEARKRGMEIPAGEPAEPCRQVQTA